MFKTNRFLRRLSEAYKAYTDNRELFNELVQAGRVSPAIVKMINLGEIAKAYRIPLNVLLDNDTYTNKLMRAMM